MDIKLLVVRWLLAKDLSNRGVLINEYSANKAKARADMVYVSEGDVIAVEIKSSRDKLDRLEEQLVHLKKMYNRVEVVTAIRHCERAREICLRMHVGFHLIEDLTITTILKGRRRNLERAILEKRLFPKHVRQRKDFSPTEGFYREFLRRKYGNTVVNTVDAAVVDAAFVRSLNPHYMRSLKARERRENYYRELESLSKSLQSTQSSSKVRDDTSNP